jgi:hypothetical protein
MRSMDRPPLEPDRLSYRSGGYRYSLSFDEDYLTVDCQRRPTYSKVAKTPLRDLKAELTTERWIPDSARSRGTEARYLSAIAVVVFFSDAHKYVPLLAPVCLLLAAMAMYRAFQSSWPLTKTVIRKDDEGYVESIPHIGGLEIQRKAFEEALSRAVKAARNEDHERTG